MIRLPDRIGGLIGRIERGETVTREELDRLATLQALDLVKAGEEFVYAAAAEDERRSKELAEI